MYTPLRLPGLHVFSSLCFVFAKRSSFFEEHCSEWRRAHLCPRARAQPNGLARCAAPPP